MFRFLFQKLIHKKWMVISLLIGNILLIAVAAGNPMYREASLHRMLTDEFEYAMEWSRSYPAIFSVRSTRSSSDAEAFAHAMAGADNVSSRLGVELVEKVRILWQSPTNADNLSERGGTRELQVQVTAMTDFEEHIQIVSGKMYGETSDGTVEAVVSEGAMVKLNLIIGDVIRLRGAENEQGDPLTLRIVGVFSYADNTDPYWVSSPSSYDTSILIDMERFQQLYMGEYNQKSVVLMEDCSMLDYAKIRPTQVRQLMSRTEELVREFKPYGMAEGLIYTGILEGYQSKAARVSVTLTVLQVPILVLLCAFLFMISGQMLSMEQNEISILKSRGASGVQIFSIYLLQSLLLSLVSLIAGLPLGAFFCQMLGSSNAFLEFVQRRYLEITIDGQVLLYALAAALVSVVVTVIPVIRYSRISIVNLKQKKNRSTKPLWQKLFLDFIVLGVSIYGCYVFSLQREDIAEKVMGGSSLDPLLYFSSSLFILGAGLLALRLAPLLVKAIFWIGKKRWKPEEYAAFLQQIRTGNRQFFIMEFLMLTVALGIFNATVARTILSNAENNTLYQTGADLVMEEVWPDNSLQVMANPELNLELTYTEPDYTRFSQIEGVKSIARVLRRTGSFLSGERKDVGVTIMGIVTDEFGETACLQPGLNPHTFAQYLNVLSTNPNAILVSRNLQTEMGYKVGDWITYKMADKETITGQIYGFFDYFPTYVSETTQILPDGSGQTTSNYMIVAHLGTIQQKWNVEPYELWFSLEEDGADHLHAYIEDTDAEIRSMVELDSQIRAIRNDTLFQGTNGILTMSFIVILILCGAGFLIYWILSIRSRELLFGVLRAMGMSRNGILKMLIDEQVFSSLLYIGIGAGIGVLASRLYVPLIQIAYAAEVQSLPLELITRSGDMVRLFAVIGVVFVVCMFVLARIVFRMKITNALKLGED